MYNQNYYSQTQRPPVAYLKGRPVQSLEEAQAQVIDFDGSIFFFPDLVNNKIYTKQLNMDGTVSFKMYEFKEMPMPQEPGYVTKDELQEILGKFQERLTQTKRSAESAPAEFLF